ncbi:hypothetical protein ATCCBAA256_33020 [Mycobacterium montefiorense]|nr:hypothetical protein ATCCBAA256_33020 [Mycobacterium montefiorense]
MYAERLRREAQATRLTGGDAQWTKHFHEPAIRIKLDIAWRDAIEPIPDALWPTLTDTITGRTLRSLGIELAPRNMTAAATSAESELLSLIEAEHEALMWLVAKSRDASVDPGHSISRGIAEAPENFRTDVNRIFEAYALAFSLTQSSRIIDIESQEMHNAVVAPTLYLLHQQPRFAATETVYQKALAEIRNGDAADAITDAATALHEALRALGCTGKTLGELLTSAKKTGLVKGNDTPLTKTIADTVSWVAATRNDGEAHWASDATMSDAWMVVHVVGALIIRLAEPRSEPTSQSARRPNLRALLPTD